MTHDTHGKHVTISSTKSIPETLTQGANRRMTQGSASRKEMTSLTAHLLMNTQGKDHGVLLQKYTGTHRGRTTASSSHRYTGRSTIPCAPLLLKTMHIRKHLDERISKHLDASQSTEQGGALWAISEPKKRPSRLLKPENRHFKQDATSKGKTWNLLAQGTQRACTTKRKGRQFILGQEPAQKQGGNRENAL